MRKVISTKREITEKGIFRIDCIDDDFNGSNFVGKSIDAIDLPAALTSFKETQLAYALRFVPTNWEHGIEIGQLVAYKETEFPVDLPLLKYYTLDCYITQDESTPETYEWFSESFINGFSHFYSHFPELIGPFQRKVLTGLSKIQTGVKRQHPTMVNRGTEQLAELLDVHIEKYATWGNFEQRLKDDYCNRFLSLEDLQQTETQNDVST